MKDDYDASVDNRKSVIPNDIATRTGINQGTDADGNVTYVAFSFYVINYSGRAVDLDLTLNLDSVTYNGNTTGYHVDDALRVMVIQGESLLTDEDYTIYAKAEKTEEDKAALYEDSTIYGEYYDTTDWLSDKVIFERLGDEGITDLKNGEAVKFTIVMWLEGRDVACSNSIFGEMAKLSMDFVGY
jgi:hypothetical protein